MSRKPGRWAMSRSIASLFGEEVVPGGREAISVRVSTLVPLRFVGNCLGIRGRPQLMCPRVVQSVLLQEAMRAEGRGEVPSRRRMVLGDTDWGRSGGRVMSHRRGTKKEGGRGG